MTINELMDLELDTPVSYGMFSRLLYKGKDERHVVLEDAIGGQNKIYIDLFLNNAKIATSKQALKPTHKTKSP